MTEQELAAVLAAVVTPERLWAEIDTRRRECSPRLPWWRVAVQMDVSFTQITRLRNGGCSPAVRRAATRWLERHPAPGQS